MTMIYTGCGSCAQCVRGNDARCINQRPLFLGEDLDGGYAEFVLVNERIVISVPPTVRLVDAAILTCTLGTAYHALVTRGNLHQGDRVIITGASGGAGRHAVQVAHHLGAHVTAVVSAATSAELVSQHGADSVIVSENRVFAKSYKKANGVGADMVLDVVGAPTLLESLHAVREGGLVVVLGNVEGKTVDLPPAYLVLKEVSIIGTKSCGTNEMRTVLDNVALGHYRPDVSEIIPLHDAADAHRRIESGAIQGRVVLANEGLINAKSERA